MPLKNTPSYFHTLTFRLILWNSVGFVLAAIITLVVFDFQNRKYLDRRLDKLLETKLREIKGLDSEQLDQDLFASEIGHHSRAMGESNVFYRLLDARGNELAASDMTRWAGFPQDMLSLESITTAQPIWDTFRFSESGATARVINKKLPSGEIVQIGLSTEDRELQQRRSRWIIATSMLLVSLLGSVFTAFIGTGTLKGLKRIARHVVNLTRQGDFSKQIELPTGSVETDELADNFNRVFNKVQKLMEGMAQVLGDIAHDMRTPVTRIRGAAESILSEPGITTREEDLAGNTIEECDCLLGLVNTILEINAAETHLDAPGDELLDLVSLVRAGADLFTFMMEDKNLALSMSLPETVVVKGDKGNLQRVLSNLLDNAIKYTPEGGQIHIRLYRDEAMNILEIEDTGVGVPEQESELIFRRFFRSDKSRTLPGNGLGLTFCRAVISAIGGRVYLGPKKATGSVFVVELPAVEDTESL